MKHISSVLMLTLLAACNGGSGGGGGMKNVSRDFLNSPIGNIQRGRVIDETSTGTAMVYSYENGDLNVAVQPHGRSTSKLVIAIRGQKLFLLEQSNDRKTITTQKAPTQDEISSALNMPGYNRVGDRLVFTQPAESETEETGNGVVLTYSQVDAGSISMSNFFCDQIFTMSQTNIRMVKNGVTSNLGNTSTTNVTTCGSVLSKDELRALDLRDVEYCDDADDKECVEHQNMSDLISDLQ